MKGILLLLTIFVVFSCTTSKPVQKKLTNTSKPTLKIKPTTSTIQKPVTTLENIKASKLSNYTVSIKYFPSISKNERIRFLVVHYTALDDATSIRALTQKDVSAHYFIPEKNNDSIEIFVPEDQRAWHAGVSKWEKFENLNDTSIGIEIANKGFSVINDTLTYYEYPDYQIKKVGSLVLDIINRYQIKPNYVLAHSDIAPQRKSDPGPKFPWKKLYDEYGIGAWYDELVKNEFLEAINLGTLIYDVPSIQKELLKYGYDVEQNGVSDEKLKKVIIAFQHHFRPQNYDGIMDAESFAILLALNKKYKSQ